MGRSVGVRFWPELPLMIRAANGGCEPKIPDAADSSNVLSSQVTSSKSSIRS